MRQLLNKGSYFFKSLIALIVLISFLLFVEPTTNFSLSFIPLMLLWMTVFLVFSGIASHFTALSSKGLQRMVSASMASIVVLLVMFSALGQLGLFDVLLLIALAVLGVFYFSRTWPK